MYGILDAIGANLSNNMQQRIVRAYKEVPFNLSWCDKKVGPSMQRCLAISKLPKKFSSF